MSVDEKAGASDAFTWDMMYLAAGVGRCLQEDKPWIADQYRGGLLLDEILRENKVPEEYGVSASVALSGVQFALNGNPNPELSSYGSYGGLIGPKEHAQRARRKG